MFQASSSLGTKKHALEDRNVSFMLAVERTVASRTESRIPNLRMFGQDIRRLFLGILLRLQLCYSMLCYVRAMYLTNSLPPTPWANFPLLFPASDPAPRYLEVWVEFPLAKYMMFKEKKEFPHRTRKAIA